MMHKISVVSPVYKSRLSVLPLVDELVRVLSSITSKYEIILVDDHCPENSWELIVKATTQSDNIKGVKLSRNFGQHYAITAGLEKATGDWVVVMDCDLQDSPYELPCLFEKALEGYDIVLARRENRQDNRFKILLSDLFYKVFGYLTGTKQDSSVANFGIYHRKVINAILSMRDQVRFFPTMVQWVGFNRTYINVAHNQRGSGKSSYTLSKLLNLAIDNIIAYSDKPLRIVVKVGFLITSISFIIGFYYLIQYYSGSITVTGFTSLIISIWFLSGIIISILGTIGLYIGKLFDKVKDRPMYIIEEEINF